MSWQQGQTRNGDGNPFSFTRVPRPLAAMMGAVLTAAQKPLAEAGLKTLQDRLAEVPTDIDWHGFLHGVQAYQTSTVPHDRPALPVLAREGRVTLCAPRAGALGVGSAVGSKVVVLVPSMVNRGYILDLAPGYSLVEALEHAGYVPWVVDWGNPVDGSVMALDDVVLALDALLREAARLAGGAVSVLGYCMGGLLAVAAAQRVGKNVVGRLAVGAMPWDFLPTVPGKMMPHVGAFVEPWLTNQPVLPVEVMHHFFWMLDPWGPVRRITAMGREPDGPRKDVMVRLEDWLSDGLPLDGPVATSVLLGWYGGKINPAQGAWKVDGQVVDPRALEMPVWVAITQQDALVPPASSLPFVGQLRQAVVHTAPTGHVGLVAGRKAQQAFYDPLIAWLNRETTE